MPLSDCCIRMPPGRDAVQAQYALFTFLAVLIVWGVMAWWVAFVLDRLLRKQYTCTLLNMVSQHLKWPHAWWVPSAFTAWCPSEISWVLSGEAQPPLQCHRSSAKRVLSCCEQRQQ